MSMLERAASFGPWYVRSGAGIACAVVGGGGLIEAYVVQFGTGQPVPTVGNLAILLPILGVTVVLAVISFLRRERPVVLPVAGLAMALAAPVVGWIVLVAAVAAAALVVLGVIAKFH